MPVCTASASTLLNTCTFSRSVAGLGAGVPVCYQGVSEHKWHLLGRRLTYVLPEVAVAKPQHAVVDHAPEQNPTEHNDPVDPALDIGIILVHLAAALHEPLHKLDVRQQTYFDKDDVAVNAGRSAKGQVTGQVVLLALEGAVQASLCAPSYL